MAYLNRVYAKSDFTSVENEVATRKMYTATGDVGLLPTEIVRQKSKVLQCLSRNGYAENFRVA